MPREGDFHCYFSRRGVDEPRAQCRIVRSAGGAWQLEGSGGPSPQLAGRVRELNQHSFRFEGSLAASPGAKAEPVFGEFEVVDVHVYRGALPTARGPLWVTIAYVPHQGPGGVVIP